MQLIDILTYIILIYIFIFAVNSEKLDLYCPKDIKKYDCNKCGNAKGKYYIDGKYQKDDDNDIILSKIQFLSEMKNIVKWRRVYILSFVSVFLSCLLNGYLYSGRRFLIMIMTIFIIFYGSLSYYYFHFERFPEFYIKENIHNLRTNLNISTQNKPKLIY